jgi:hypothetical protein
MPSFCICLTNAIFEQDFENVLFLAFVLVYSGEGEHGQFVRCGEEEGVWLQD